MSLEAITLTTCVQPIDGVICSLPAEVTDRCVLESTDGPLEHISTQCPLGHRLFLMPTEMLDRYVKDSINALADGDVASVERPTGTDNIE